MTIWRAEFQQNIQPATHGRFSVPSEIVHAANLASGSTVDAEITIGRHHHFGPITLTSGFEVLLPPGHPLYHVALPGEPIHVTLRWLT